MTSSLRRCVVLASCLLLVGCLGASYSEPHDEADALRDTLGWGPPVTEFDPGALLPRPPASLELDRTLAAGLSLDEVTGEVVRRNPDVVAALERWVAFLERAPQVTALPNPTASYRYSSMFKMHAAGVVQEIPFPGKLLAEGRAALAEARAMRAELAERANVLRAQAATSLADLHLARRQAEIVDENLALMDRFVELARTRYAAGTVTQSDVLRAEVEREGLRVERAAFARDVEVAESALNVLLDRAPDAPLGPVATLPEPAAPPALTLLFEQAFQRRPELQAARERWAAGRDMLDRAELEWLPDFVAGADYVRDVGSRDDELEATVGLSLPIWVGRIRAGIAQAEADVRRAEAETRSTRNRVLDEVRRASSRLVAAIQRHRIVRDEALPRAQQNVQVSEAAYTAGKLDLLALIDTQRQRLQQQLTLEGTRAEQTAAEAELRRAVGETDVLDER